MDRAHAKPGAASSAASEDEPSCEPPERPELLDTKALLADIRIAADYAARVGLLTSKPAIVRAMKDAEAARADPDTPDSTRFAVALDKICDAIRPMTLDELKERHPSSPEVRAMLPKLKLRNGFLAVVVMFFIGSFMVVLRHEQNVIQEADKISFVDTQLGLRKLRKQAEESMGKKGDAQFAENFDRNRAEFLKLLTRVENTTAALREAEARYAFFPWIDKTWWWSMPGLRSAHAAQPVAEATAAAPSPSGQCEADGAQLKMPAGVADFPPYLREGIREIVHDYCFLQKVLAPGAVAPTMDFRGPSQYVEPVRANIDIGLNWMLPFLCGLLGTLIRFHRTIGDPRLPFVTPADAWVRRFLGGVGGIVIGWFVTPSAAAFGGGLGSISLPMALAFLTGYGIEILFRVLDRISQLVGSQGTNRERSTDGTEDRIDYEKLARTIRTAFAESASGYGHQGRSEEAQASRKGRGPRQAPQA